MNKELTHKHLGQTVTKNGTVIDGVILAVTEKSVYVGKDFNNYTKFDKFEFTVFVIVLINTIFDKYVV